jgi:hypothetical protein
MAATNGERSGTLNLRRGDFVKVRSQSEILATLDENGELEGLPFMPEMLQFCGKTLRVYRRADRTCDTINNSGIRRLKDSVHLEDSRCFGEAHGGCQARCLLFWKEAWLRREASGVQDQFPNRVRSVESVSQPVHAGGLTSRCELSTLTERTRKGTDGGEERFSCQATELFRATAPLSPTEIGPYLRDLRSGNISVWELVRGAGVALFQRLVRLGGYRAWVWMYDRVQKFRGRCPYPYKHGNLTKTPSATLDLQPGEFVHVKSHEEILKTVDTRNRNRGLSFDPEMVTFCGGRYRVLQRVERIINERTGKMIRFSAPPIMLEGVACKSKYTPGKLFCPRSIPSYWREIWLERAE